MGSEDSNRPQSRDPSGRPPTGLPRAAHTPGVCPHWTLGLPGSPPIGQAGPGTHPTVGCRKGRQVLSGSEDVPDPDGVASVGPPANHQTLNLWDTVSAKDEWSMSVGCLGVSGAPSALVTTRTWTSGGKQPLCPEPPTVMAKHGAGSVPEPPPPRRPALGPREWAVPATAGVRVRGCGYLEPRWATSRVCMLPGHMGCFPRRGRACRLVP